MDFGHDLVRLRPNRVSDRVNPARMVTSWDSPDEVEFTGWVDDFTSTEEAAEVAGPLRSQAKAKARLYVEERGVDIRRGDRIRDGDHVWAVVGFPSRPRNPFTGWVPYTVVNLEEVTG